MREEIALSKRFSIICRCSPARFALTGPLLAVCKCKISKIYLKSKKNLGTLPQRIEDLAIGHFNF